MATEAPDGVPSTIDAAKMVQLYVACRDRIDAMNKAHTAAVQPIKEAMEKIEIVLLGQLQKQNASSIATDFGTFYKETSVSVTIGDKEQFRTWVLDSPADRINYVDVRAAKKNIETFKTEHAGNLPPGITWREEVEVHVRRK
jgi:hypothetical protein